MKVVWTAWMAVVVALTAPFLYTNVRLRYGRPLGQALFWALLFAVFAAAIKLRRGRLHRYEIPIIGALIVLPAVILEPRATAFITMLLAAAISAGWRICKWMNLPAPGIAIEAGIGAGIQICGLILLGMTGLLRPWPVATLLLFCFAIGWRALFEWKATRLPTDAVTSVLLVFVVIFAWSAAMMYLSPTVMFDSFATHLASARVFAASHQLRPVQFLDYSILPQGFELLMAAGYLFGGQMAAQMVSPLFLALACAALFTVAKGLGADRGIAFAAAVFGCSLPFVQWTGSVVKNDLPVAFFQLAALAAWMKWPVSRNFRWVVVASFLTALSFSVKGTAVLAGIPLGLLCLYAAWQQPMRVRSILTVAAVFAVFGTFWFARSFLLTGQLMYPYTRQVGAMIHPSNTFGTKLMRLAGLPWRLHFQGGDAFDYQSPTPLGAFFLLFTPAILWNLRKRWTTAQQGAAVFVVLTLAIWTQAWVIVRYSASAFAVAAVIVVLMLAHIWPNAPRWFRGVIVAAGLYSLIFDWSIVASLGARTERLLYLAHMVSREEYLSRMEPMYPPLAWLRDHAEPDALILGVTEWAKAYAPDPEKLNSTEDRRINLTRVRNELAYRPYRYLILPVGARPEAFIASPELCYSDSYFSVFKLFKEAGR